MRSKKRSLGGLTLFATLTVLVAASLAHATEVSRAEYVAAVEPICKSNVSADERILGGVKRNVKEGKLKPAAAQFAKAATALKKALAELKAVPQPVADKARLAKWLGYVGTEASLFEKVSKKLKTGDRIGAQAMEIRLTHNASLANNLTAGFEFRYCRVEPSRFG